MASLRCLHILKVEKGMYQAVEEVLECLVITRAGSRPPFLVFVEHICP